MYPKLYLCQSCQIPAKLPLFSKSLFLLVVHFFMLKLVYLINNDLVTYNSKAYLMIIKF